MTDIHKQCKALWDKLMRREITHEEFQEEIRKLKEPEEVDWAEEEEPTVDEKGWVD